jgi:hypothetical protein
MGQHSKLIDAIPNAWLRNLLQSVIELLPGARSRPTTIGATDCKTCGQPSRTLWAGEDSPNWVSIHAASYMELVRCPACGEFWCQGFYEPYSAFRYSVRWNAGEELFLDVANRDSGSLIQAWHKAEVRWQANYADARTLAQIKAHYKRSHGYVNLTKSNRPNTIDLRHDTEPE